MCVRGGEWLTDDKGALASLPLWTALPVASKDSSVSEYSLSTRRLSSDPDIKATTIQPPVLTSPEDQQAAAATQPEVPSSQQRSSFPLTLDSTYIHLHHFTPTATALPLHCPPPPPPAQPPSYAQSLAKSHFCHSDTLSEPPAYTSATVVTQPPRAMWTSVSTASSTVANGQPTQVLRRISSTSSSGAISSIASATHIYSQKLSKPTSTSQGKLIILHFVFFFWINSASMSSHLYFVINHVSDQEELQ